MIDDPITDERLLQAIRKRLLDEIAEQQSGGTNVINNNVYGGGQIPSGGVEAMMQDSGIDPEDRSYFVDILKREFEPGDSTQFYDPNVGDVTDVPLQHGGWGKQVHRFSVPKKKDRQPMMGYPEGSPI